MIRVGPAGWSYPDWDGFVYPAPRPPRYDPLALIASLFDLVEINATFYRPATASTSESWVRRVEANPKFVFTAKLWQGLTHVRSEPHTDQEKAWRAGIRPLLDAGRLSAVLVQFPHSFRPDRAGLAYLGELVDRLSDLPLVVELRRSGWETEETLAWLREKRVAFCNLDQPPVGIGAGATLGPTAHATASNAYVRLHGRNRENWFVESAGRDARYDYLYSASELEPWIERISRLAETAEEVHVVTNNHFRGKAVVNALMIKAMIEGAPVDTPATLLRAYPDLAPHVNAPPQGRLF